MRNSKNNLISVLVIACMLTGGIEFAGPLMRWNNSMVWAQSLASDRQEAEKLLNLCRENLRREEAEAAIQSCNSAVKAFQKMSDRPGQATSGINLGIAYKRAEENEQALDPLNVALALAQELGDRRIEALAQHNLADVYDALGQTRKAQSLRIEAKPYIEKKNIADQRLNEGNDQFQKSQFSMALESWQGALTIYREIGDRQDEGATLGNMGIAYDSLGDYEKAIVFHNQSLAIERELRNRLGEAQSLGNLGNVYDSLGKYEKAIVFHNQSLAISRRLGYRLVEAQSLGNLGSAYFSLGNYEKSITFHEQYLAISQELGYQLGEAQSLGNLGLAYFSLGDYGKAIDFHEQYLAISRELGYQLGEAQSLGNLGLAYFSLGDYGKAIDFHEQYLAISRELGYQLGEANSLGNLGLVYKSLGYSKKSIDFHLQSLAIAQDIGNRLGVANSLGSLGSAYFALGDYEKAIDFHNQSLAVSREIGDRLGVAGSFGNLGVVYNRLGKSKQALEFYQQYLAIAQDIGDRSGEGIALNNIGHQLDALNEPDLAISFFKQSVNVREGIRADLTGLSNTLQNSYTQTVAGTYRKLADLLIARGRISEAQEVLELLRVQELNDFNQGTRSPDKLTKIDLNAAETQIKAKHGSLIAFGSQFYDCEQKSCDQLESLRKKYKVLDQAFYELATEITQKVEANRQQQVADDTTDFQASADKVVSAHENSVLIYPLVLPDKVRLLWASKGGVLADEVCPLSEADLNITVANFQDLLSTASSEITEVKRVGKQLYDCLIKPLEPELEANGIKHLIFSPDRTTNYIPMGALYDGKQFLIQRFRVSNVLSAGLTNTDGGLPTEPQNISVLGLGLSESKKGFSPLLHVPQEIDTVVRSDAQDSLGIFSGLAFLNQAFDLSALENNVQGRQIVHIATHGEFLPARPRDSYLLLGTGKKYPIPEIQSLRQLRGVHLVVLSACETARSGEDHKGIEVAGMSSYFLRDKAEAVIASLWKVNDASTKCIDATVLSISGHRQNLQSRSLATSSILFTVRGWGSIYSSGEASHDVTPRINKLEFTGKTLQTMIIPTIGHHSF